MLVPHEHLKKIPLNQIISFLSDRSECLETNPVVGLAPG
jgi:hypothetical protein